MGDFLEEVTPRVSFPRRERRGGGIPVTRDSPGILRGRPEGGLGWEAVCGRVPETRDWVPGGQTRQERQHV